MSKNSSMYLIVTNEPESFAISFLTEMFHYFGLSPVVDRQNKDLKRATDS